MNIRRFRAHNVTEALAMVKAELGDDAVILNTARRRVRDSITGTASSVVEVVAAVDFDVDEFSGTGTGSLSAGSGDKVMKSRGDATVAGTGDGSSTVSGRRNAEAATGQGLEGLNDKDMDQDTGYVLRSELRELRGMVEKMTNRDAAHHTKSAGDGPFMHGDTYHAGVMPSPARYPLMVIQEVFDFLGMDTGLQRGLAANFLRHCPAARPVNHRTVYHWLRQYCEEYVVEGPRAHSFKRPCWWAFIGPTGVGKTTTLAKVAAHLKFRHGLRGHLVTVDTYRLGGVEQLKKYAELMDIPFSTAKNTGELVKIFSENRAMDFILVDTIGRNSRSSRHHVELEKMFDAVPGLSAQALLCAAYKTEDMVASVKTYRQFPICGWTISKADETGSVGSLCSPVMGWKLPLSYITDGQKVPEDIKPASRENVMELLFARGDAHFKRDMSYAKTNGVKGARPGVVPGNVAFVEGQR